MDSANSTGKAFVDALVRLDFEGMETTLEPNVKFRALVPGEFINVSTASEAVGCFRRWLGDKTDLELLHFKSGTLIDRLLVEYGFRLRRKNQPYLVEQRICATVENGKLAVMDMVCSGLRPEGVIETEAQVHPGAPKHGPALPRRR
jgi:hypothetical protein